ncbi:MAG: FG-GAP-like repeat-containing protein [Verrucomicrobiota bacterium]|nr:FG-GAP-like repeat-containing protein [Verrucomicrobiota bacterium]
MQKTTSQPPTHKTRSEIFLKNHVRLIVAIGLALAAFCGPSALADSRGYRGVKITTGQNGFGGTIDPSDEFGSAVAGIGDVDGDGVPDIAVGSQWDGDGGLLRGAIWIIFLNADRTVRAEQKISGTEGNLNGLDDFSFFGSSISSIGDLNGDGVPDIAVGAPGADGAVWILFLNSDGTVQAQQIISDTEGGFTGDLVPATSLGEGLGSLGDLDGDGVVDLVVGAPLDDDGGDEGDPFANLGAVYILFLNADGTVKNTQKISQTEGGFTGTLTFMENFGFGAASAGDVNGDGITDLIVGTLDSSSDLGIQGAVYIVFLNRDGTAQGQQKISGTEGGFTGVLAPNELFGYDVAPVGDLDGDGVPDVAVGAIGDNAGDDGSGAVWILFLNSDGTVKGFKKIADRRRGAVSGTGRVSLNAFDQFGSGVALLEDLNGNGRPELIVGAFTDGEAGNLAGSVWIVSLGGGGNR